MIRAQAHAYIMRPRSEVFRYVATDFFVNYPRWSPEVRLLRPTSPGPIAVGSTGWQVRVDYGRRTEVNFRVTAFEADSRIEFRGVSLPMLSSYRFAEVGGRTRLTFAFELERLDLFMRPFSGMINMKVQQGVEQVVRNIKQLLEVESDSIAVSPRRAMRM